MNEPFLLSNLIDLQDIDNKITKLVKKKLEGETVITLKNLEKNFKDVSKKIYTFKESLSEYYSEKKSLEKKLLEQESKLSNVNNKLKDTNLNAIELQNYNLQKSSVESTVSSIFHSLDLLSDSNKDEVTKIENLENELSSLKLQLIEVSKLLQIEWSEINKNINNLEKEKQNLIQSFPNDIKLLYDELKIDGVEVIAAYKNENQCGCCGVSLTSSEIDTILDSKYHQCPYCKGILI